VHSALDPGISLWVALAVSILFVAIFVKSRVSYLRIPKLHAVARDGKPPDCMVVIPARNEEKVIARAVKSFPHDTVIVVDDHSEDGTAEVARQAADEAKHYELIATRLAQLGFDADTFDPLAGGFGPLTAYLETLTTSVERVAAGQFTREAIAIVKNRQFIEFCERAGDATTATLYRDIIQPDERYQEVKQKLKLLERGTHR